MEEIVRKRMQDILCQKDMTINAFAKAVGENQSKLNKQISLSTSISLNTILLLLKQFPDVSAEWLLRGTGEMTAESSGSEEAELRETIRRQQREIDGLYERIAELKGGSYAASQKIASIAYDN